MAVVAARLPGMEWPELPLQMTAIAHGRRGRERRRAGPLARRRRARATTHSIRLAARVSRRRVAGRGVRLPRTCARSGERTEQKELAGKVAFVTGSAGGIGLG